MGSSFRNFVGISESQTIDISGKCYIVTTQNKALRKLIVAKLLNKSDLNIYNRI